MAARSVHRLTRQDYALAVSWNYETKKKKLLSNPMLPNNWFHYKFWFISRKYPFESFLPPDISYSHVQCPGVLPVFWHPTSCFPIDEGYRTNIFINKDIVRSQVAMGEADLIVSSWPMLQSLAEFFTVWCPWDAKVFEVELMLRGVWS